MQVFLFSWLSFGWDSKAENRRNGEPTYSQESRLPLHLPRLTVRIPKGTHPIAPCHLHIDQEHAQWRGVSEESFKATCWMLFLPPPSPRLHLRQNDRDSDGTAWRKKPMCPRM